MISLSSLAGLARTFAAELDIPTPPLLVGDRKFDLAERPAVMGCINLSRDSTYRESIAPSTSSAIRRGRVLAAQGADFVDIGAEASNARAGRVDPDRQIAMLVPVIEALAADEILVSVETYEPRVVRACLRAGAQILNFTGVAHQDEILELAAEFRTTVVLCYVKGENIRDAADVALDADRMPELSEYFSSRTEVARRSGVERIVIDPGMGFTYGNLMDPRTRVAHQTQVILNTFRLRRLGFPICNAMPHAFDLFEDQFRTAEGFFTVLGHLGGTTIFRTHEVPQVVAVLEALRTLEVAQSAPVQQAADRQQ